MADYTIAETIEATPALLGEASAGFGVDGLASSTAVLEGVQHVNRTAGNGPVLVSQTLLGAQPVVVRGFTPVVATPAFLGETSYSLVTDGLISTSVEMDSALLRTTAVGGTILAFTFLTWPAGYSITGLISVAPALLGAPTFATTINDVIDPVVEVDGGPSFPWSITGLISSTPDVQGDVLYTDVSLGFTVSGIIAPAAAVLGGLRLDDLINETIAAAAALTGETRYGAHFTGLISTTPTFLGDVLYADIAFPYTISGVIAPTAAVFGGFLLSTRVFSAPITVTAELQGAVDLLSGIEPVDYLLSRQTVEVEYFDVQVFETRRLPVPVGQYVKIPPPSNCSDMTKASWSMVEDGVVNVYRSYDRRVEDDFIALLVSPVLLGDLVVA